MVAQFITEEFLAGKQYSTLNSYRSALSATISPIEGHPVGQHPTIVKLLQGVFNRRPPAPRFQVIWSVSQVISCIQKMPASAELDLEDLSKKLTMLLALSNGDRSSDMQALDLRFRSFMEGGVTFRIPGLTKTRRSGPPREVIFRAFPEVPHLCPVVTLKEYERRTATLRKQGKEGSKPLLISFRKPHQPVSSSTIGRWLKKMLAQSGIDTTLFSAHSTRSAATSSAKAAGLSTSDIMKMAGWSRQSTFERFYHRPVEEPNVVIARGAQGMSTNHTLSYMQPCHDSGIVNLTSIVDVTRDCNFTNGKASI